MTIRRRSTVRVRRVLAVAGATTAAFSVLAACGGSEPQPFRLEAWGNISAMWGSDTGSGKLDLYSGHDQQTVNAKAVTLTVISTMPGGARCSITDGAGKVLDDESQAPSSGAAGLAATTTAYCSAPITPTTKP